MFYAKGEFSLSTYVNTPSGRIRFFFLFFYAPNGLPFPQHLKNAQKEQCRGRPPGRPACFNLFGPPKISTSTIKMQEHTTKKPSLVREGGPLAVDE